MLRTEDECTDESKSNRASHVASHAEQGTVASHAKQGCLKQREIVSMVCQAGSSLLSMPRQGCIDFLALSLMVHTTDRKNSSQILC